MDSHAMQFNGLDCELQMAIAIGLGSSPIPLPVDVYEEATAKVRTSFSLTN